MNKRVGLLPLLLLASTVLAQTLERRGDPTSTGVVLPDRAVTLAAKIVGRVAAVNAEEGDAVEAGAVLIDIDDAVPRADLAAARAELERQQINRAHMKKLADRVGVLRKQNAASQENLDDAQFRYAAAEQSVASAEASAAKAAAMLEETKIRAPFSGVIIEKRVEVGDVTSPGEPLLRLESHDRLKFRTSVKEHDVVGLRRGQQVTIIIDALDDLRLSATVSKIIPSGDRTTHEFDVEAVLPARDGLFPGMFGKAEFAQ